MPRWKSLDEEEPPIDRFDRCDDIWKYNSQGADIVWRGEYVAPGLDDAAPEPPDFTHWTLPKPGEKLPPPPPVL